MNSIIKLESTFIIPFSSQLDKEFIMFINSIPRVALNRGKQGWELPIEYLDSIFLPYTQLKSLVIKHESNCKKPFSTTPSIFLAKKRFEAIKEFDSRQGKSEKRAYYTEINKRLFFSVYYDASMVEFFRLIKHYYWYNNEKVWSFPEIAKQELLDYFNKNKITIISATDIPVDVVN